MDGGACEPVCPVETIYYEHDLPGEFEPFLADNARFFDQALPGRSEPIGSPGGAVKLGRLEVSTELVASHLPQAVPTPWPRRLGTRGHRGWFTLSGALGQRRSDGPRSQPDWRKG